MPNYLDEAAREADLAMWKRRASYDPMKAAAEGKRKLEEKKSTHASKYNERCELLMQFFYLHLTFITNYLLLGILVCNGKELPVFKLYIYVKVFEVSSA